MDTLILFLVDSGHEVYVINAKNSENLSEKVINLTLDEYVGGKYNGNINSIIFDFPIIDEDILFEYEVDAFGKHQMFTDKCYEFLKMMKIIIKHQIFKNGGNIWTLEYDDTFQYFFSTPISPIFTNMRISAFRSLCKEFARFNISFNNIILQPEVELIDPEIYKKQVSNLKVFALKYNLPKRMDNVQFIYDRITDRRPLVNGTIAFCGTSPSWNNY
jgi:hypothetical protein